MPMSTSSIILVVTMVLVVIIMFGGLGAMACKVVPSLTASASLAPRNEQEARDAKVAEHTLDEAQWKCSPNTVNARGKNTPTRLTRRDGQTHVECMSPNGSGGKGCRWVSSEKCQQLVDAAANKHLTCGPDHEAKLGKGKTGYHTDNHWCMKQMVATMKGYETLSKGNPTEILMGFGIMMEDPKVNRVDMDKQYLAAVRRIMSENTCDELNKPIGDSPSLYKLIVYYLLLIRSHVMAANVEIDIGTFYQKHKVFLQKLVDLLFGPPTSNKAIVTALVHNPQLSDDLSPKFLGIPQEYITLLSKCV